MDSYGILLTYGFLWSPADSYGFLWILMDSYGFLRLPMASYGSYGFAPSDPQVKRREKPLLPPPSLPSPEAIDFMDSLGLPAGSWKLCNVLSKPMGTYKA